MTYLFLFRGGTEKYQTMTLEESKLDTANWVEWMGKLAQMGHNPMGLPLNTPGSKIVMSDKSIDGAYSSEEAAKMIGGDTKGMDDKVTGYLLLEADDLEMAEKMAQMCPTLEMGGFVEIRECGKM